MAVFVPHPPEGSSENRPSDTTARQAAHNQDSPLTPQQEKIGMTALDKVLEAMGAPAGALYLVNEQRQSLSLIAQRGMPPTYLQQFTTLTLGETIVGRVAQQREPRWITDAEETLPPIGQGMDGQRYRCVLVAPLVIWDETIGVLVAAAPDAHHFANLPQPSLTAMIDQTALALYNLWLMRQTHRHADELDLILHAGRSLARSTVVEEALSKLAQTLVEQLPVTACRILLLDEAQETLFTQTLYAQRPVEWPANLWEPIPLTEAKVYQRALTEAQPTLLYKSPGPADPPHAFPLVLLSETEINSLLFTQAQAGALIPLLVDDQVMGLILLGEQRSWERITLAESKLRICQALAYQASLVLSRAQLYERQQRRATDLATLQRISTAVAATSSPEALYQLVVTELARNFHYPLVALYTLEDDILRLQAHSTAKADIVPPPTNPLGEGVIGRAALSGQPLLLSNIYQATDHQSAERKMGAEVGVPLHLGDRILGVIHVASEEPDSLTQDDLDLLDILAAQVTVAMENIRLLAEEQRRRQQAEALREMSAAITSTLDLHEVARQALASLRRVVPYESAALTLMEGEHWRILFATDQADSQPLVETLIPREDRKASEYVVQTGRPLRIPDVRFSDLWAPAPGFEYIRSWMGVPLIVEDRVLGTLTMDSAQPGFYTEEHEAIALAFAQQMAIALENAHQYEEAQRQIRQFQALYQTSLDISTRLETQDLLQAILQRAVELLDAEGGGIRLYDPEDDTLYLAIHHGLQTLPPLRFKPGQGLVGRVFRDRRPIVVENYQAWEGRQSDALGEGPTTLMGVPLAWQDQVLGVLSVFAPSKRKRFSERDVQLLSIFATQAAIALENARLYEEIANRLRREQRLNELSESLVSELELSRVLCQAIEVAEELLDAHAGIIALLDEERQVITFPYIHNLPDSLLNVEAPLDVGLTGEVIRTRQPVAILNYETYPQGLPEFKEVGIKATLAVPLTVGDRVLGVLGVADLERSHPYSEEDISILASVGRQAAIAIQNARLFQATLQHIAEVEELKDFNERILQTMAEGLMLRTPDGRITFVNRRLEEMLGYKPGSLIDKHWTIILSPDQREKAAKRHLAQQEHCEITLQRADGTQLPVLVSATPLLAEGKPEGTLAVFTDISERKRSEELMRALGNAAVAVQAALTPDAIFQTVANELEQLGFYCLITTIDPEAAAVAIRHSSLPSPVAPVLTQALSASLAAHTVRSHREKPPAAPVNAEEVVYVEDPIRFTREALAPESDALDPASLRALAGWEMILAPLHVSGQIVGSLAVLGDLSPADLSAITVFANQIAVALEKAQLLEAERRARELSETLRQVAAALSGAQDLQQVCSLVLEHLERVVPYDSAALILHQRGEGEQGEFIIQAARGFPDDAHVPGSRFDASILLPHLDLAVPSPFLISDTQAEPGWPPSPEMAHVRSWLGAPLVVSERETQRLIGILAINSTRPHAFTQEDAEVALTFANQAALAIERARLHTETEQRVRELSVLTEISEALNRAIGLDQVLEVVLNGAFSLAGRQEASIILADRHTGALRIVAWRGLPDTFVARFNERMYPAHTGLVGEALRTGKTIATLDTSCDPRFVDFGHPPTRQMLQVPLITESEAIGVIALDTVPDADTQRLLQAIADLAATAIEKARLFEEERRRAIQLQTIREVTERVTGILDPESLLIQVAELIQTRFGYSEVTLWTLDESRQELILQVGAGIYKANSPADRVLVEGNGIINWVAQHGEPLLANDVSQEPRYRFFEPLKSTKAELAVPLRLSGRVIGVLDVQSEHINAFDQEDLFVLEALADQVSIALENARLYAAERARVAELDRAYRELQQLDRLKDEFVQNVSHELRTPLTFIKGYIELMEQELLGELNEQQREALRVMDERANAVIHLVNDIISLKKAEMEVSSPQRISLVEVAQSCVWGAKVTARQHNLELKMEVEEDLPDAWADPARLGEVFDNLIGNAIKFSPKGGTITIRMRREDGFLRVEVEDQGIGIPADKLDKIWDRFYQVDGSPARRFGGTGLGLAIVRRIIEAHGGTIEVRSEEGQGSTFIFTVPIYSPEMEKQDQEASDTDTPTPTTQEE